MKIWVTSDTHFYHTKLMEYEGRPANFNEVIISNWNKLVAPDDSIIHLGDVILDRHSELQGIMGQLNGRKILCRGNYDYESNEWYMNRGFCFVTDYYVYENVAFSHAPLTPLPYQTFKPQSKDEEFAVKPVDLNIHGHFHRSKDRNRPGVKDPYYGHDYYEQHKDKYHLVQIEDTLAPFLLDDILVTHNL